MKFYATLLIASYIANVASWTGKCTGGYTVGACVKSGGKVGTSDKHTDYGKQSCYNLSESKCKSTFCGICSDAKAK
ncbi:hypothetical protein CONCODRAFT_79952, partial [Conidiobolus coronatus NRRL 28638]